MSSTELMRERMKHILERELLRACNDDDRDAVAQLVADKHVALNCADESNGLQPLMIACQHGHLDIVKYLLLQKNTAEILDNVDAAGWSALHWSITNGHYSITKELIEFGADVDLRSESDGIYPLILSILYNQPNIAHLLLENHCSLDIHYNQLSILELLDSLQFKPSRNVHQLSAMDIARFRDIVVSSSQYKSMMKKYHKNKPSSSNGAGVPRQISLPSHLDSILQHITRVNNDDDELDATHEQENAISEFCNEEIGGGDNEAIGGMKFSDDDCDEDDDDDDDAAIWRKYLTPKASEDEDSGTDFSAAARTPNGDNADVDGEEELDADDVLRKYLQNTHEVDVGDDQDSENSENESSTPEPADMTELEAEEKQTPDEVVADDDVLDEMYDMMQNIADNDVTRAQEERRLTHDEEVGDIVSLLQDKNAMNQVHDVVGMDVMIPEEEDEEDENDTQQHTAALPSTIATNGSSPMPGVDMDKYTQQILQRVREEFLSRSEFETFEQQQSKHVENGKDEQSKIYQEILDVHQELSELQTQTEGMGNEQTTLSSQMDDIRQTLGETHQTMEAQKTEMIALLTEHKTIAQKNTKSETENVHTALDTFEQWLQEMMRGMNETVSATHTELIEKYRELSLRFKMYSKRHALQTPSMQTLEVGKLIAAELNKAELNKVEFSVPRERQGNLVDVIQHYRKISQQNLSVRNKIKIKKKKTTSAQFGRVRKTHASRFSPHSQSLSLPQSYASGSIPSLNQSFTAFDTHDKIGVYVSEGSADSDDDASADTTPELLVDQASSRSDEVRSTQNPKNRRRRRNGKRKHASTEKLDSMNTVNVHVSSLAEPLSPTTPMSSPDFASPDFASQYNAYDSDDVWYTAEDTDYAVVNDHVSTHQSSRKRSNSYQANAKLADDNALDATQYDDLYMD